MVKQKHHSDECGIVENRQNFAVNFKPEANIRHKQYTFRNIYILTQRNFKVRHLLTQQQFVRHASRKGYKVTQRNVVKKKLLLVCLEKKKEEINLIKIKWMPYHNQISQGIFLAFLLSFGQGRICA